MKTSFKNTPGIPYSSAELNAIKQLYQSKTASKVAELINQLFWKGEEVRTVKAIERKLEKVLPKAEEKTTIETKPTETAAKEPIEESTKNELVNTISSLERELTKQKALNNIITDTIKTAIVKLPSFKPPTIIIKKGMHKPETAMLELGDIHIGEKIVKEEVANLTEYNFDIFKKRLDTMRESVAECIEIQRSKIPINTLDINALGDWVTGEDIYLGQYRNVDMPLIDQVFEGGYEMINRLLLPLAGMFNKIRIRAIYGNHGRTGKPNQFHQRTNFDYIIYKFIKEYMKNQSNVEFYISEGPIMLYKLPEAPAFTHLLSHGNEVNSSASVPFYGMQRDHAKYVQMFSQPIHYWHLGHFHSTAKIDIPYGEQILNGTFAGGSELSVYKMKTKSLPKQLLFGFNNTRGITWRYDIQLAFHEDLVMDKDSIYTPVCKPRTK